MRAPHAPQSKSRLRQAAGVLLLTPAVYDSLSVCADFDYLGLDVSALLLAGLLFGYDSFVTHESGTWRLVSVGFGAIIGLILIVSWWILTTFICLALW